MVTPAKHPGRDTRLPALESLPEATATVIATIRELAPGRRVEATGLVALPAAVALGATFLAPAGLDLTWWQSTAGRPDQPWSLSAERDASTVEIDHISGDPSSQELAVVVSINHDAEEALRQSEPEVPPFRGHVRLHGPSGRPADLQTPGQAADAAFRMIDAIGDARRRWRDIRRVHLFVAAPAGFAIMVGQLLNGSGPVQTYEHIPSAMASATTSAPHCCTREPDGSANRAQ